jgi:hypothetical protein
MRAITIYQPWATCIARFGKNIENRTWNPPASLMGKRIAIHAGKKFDLNVFWRLRAAGLIPPNMTERDFPRGCVVATAKISGVVSDSDSPWFLGPLAWTLTDIREISPAIPAVGKMGIWELGFDPDQERPEAVPTVQSDSPEPLFEF